MIGCYQWNKKTNWGDRLGTHLLRHYCDIYAAATGDPQDASVVVVGSVINHLPADWAGDVLGAGKLTPHDRHISRYAPVWSLRGPLSAKGEYLPAPIAYGDLGLLAADLVPLPRRIHGLGILPHWSDEELTARPDFLKYDPLIIDPADDPLKVISQIGSCMKLVTSSLHGMILADAFSIPRRFEMARKLATEGGTFKHVDYSMAIGHPFEIGKTSTPAWPKIDTVRQRLTDVMDEYADHIHNTEGH